MATEKMPALHQNNSYKCGMCRWLYVGYEGVTCQQKRDVGIQSQACIEFEPYKPSPFDKVVRDKLLVELQSRAAVIKAETLKPMLDELKTYKVSAKAKFGDFSQYTDEADLLDIVNRLEKCQSFMDRVVDIRLDMQEKLNTLLLLMKEAQSYIFATYPEQVRNLKNDSERGAFYQGVLPDIFRSIDLIQGVVSKAESLEANLKNTHFSLKEMLAGVQSVWNYRLQYASTRNAKSMG